jgi:hypothetical protein
MIHFLFPSDPFNKRVVDPDYADDLNALAMRGFSHSLFSFEDFLEGKFKSSAPIPQDKSVVYRGWMMMPDSYSILNDTLVTSGCHLLTNPAQYRHCHYLPEWYESCREFTPASIFVPRETDFVEAVKDLGWDHYFVKDYVKSLSTSRGSIAESPEQIQEIVLLMEQYRGSVEGGVCIREVEDFLPHTEERYFVYNKIAYGRRGHVPDIVNEIATRVDSPFFSIDVVMNTSNQLRLIELGDGQVSSIKQWDPDTFAHIFSPG